MRAALVVFLSFVVVTSVGSALADTTGTRYQGFTYASDVQGYVNMTRDFCDVRAAVNARNYSGALEIYLTGKNSASGVSRRTFLRWASAVPTDTEPFYDALTMGRNGSWLDDAIRRAFAANNGPLALGLIQVAQIKYMMHEVDAAANRIIAYSKNSSLVANLNDTSGAPHNVDEAAAIFVGDVNNCGTLSGLAQSLGNNLDTTFLGVSYINMHFTNALNQLQAGARTGDAASMVSTRNRLVVALQLLGIQGVMQGAYKARLAANCRRPAADINAAKTEITVHWTYLRPLLLSYRPAGVSNFGTQVNHLQSALTAQSVDYRRVLAAVINVLASMGRRLHEVGQPNFSTINAGWRCPVPTQP